LTLLRVYLKGEHVTGVTWGYPILSMASHRQSNFKCMELHRFQRRFTLIIISRIHIKQYPPNHPHTQKKTFPTFFNYSILLPPHFQLVHLAQKMKIQRPKFHGATTSLVYLLWNTSLSYLLWNHGVKSALSHCLCYHVVLVATKSDKNLWIFGG